MSEATRGRAAVERGDPHAAEALGISPTTADRHWAYARAWLQAEVRGR